MPARRAAVELLRAVLERKQAFDDALKQSPGAMMMLNFAERDRALARLIAATTLRRLGEIEALLARFLESGMPKSSGPLRAILVSGAAQLLYLDTPPHAAIDLAVRLAQSDAKSSRYDKLVNAVLRRVDREGRQILAHLDTPRINTPDWLWQRWTAHYGEETAHEIANAHLIEPALDLTVKADPGNWTERVGGILLETGTVRLRHKGRIKELDGFTQGEWWVQDVAAALPARLLGHVRDKRVLDMCAAPGGKTAQLATAGAHVTALDLSPARLALVEENLRRLRLDAQLIEADATIWRADQPFDAILLDAPCSATGTIRRHPDIPWLKSEKEIARLAQLQARLLTNAVSLLKPGGMLVYAVCSLEPEEGIRQIERLLEEGIDVSLDEISAVEIGAHPDWLVSPGYLRTLPHQLQLHDPALSGMDGFFAARLVRSG